MVWFIQWFLFEGVFHNLKTLHIQDIGRKFQIFPRYVELLWNSCLDDMLEVDNRPSLRRESCYQWRILSFLLKLVSNLFSYLKWSCFDYCLVSCNEAFKLRNGFWGLLWPQRDETRHYIFLYVQEQKEPCGQKRPQNHLVWVFWRPISKVKRMVVSLIHGWLHHISCFTQERSKLNFGWMLPYEVPEMNAWQWQRSQRCVFAAHDLLMPSGSFRNIFYSCMYIIFIDREAREIIRLVASVRPSVRLSVRPSVCLFTRNTDQDLCVFVRNQVTFANKSCAQRSGAFIRCCI